MKYLAIFIIIILILTLILVIQWMFHGFPMGNL